MKATEPVDAGEPPKAAEAPKAGKPVEAAEAGKADSAVAQPIETGTADEVRAILKPQRITPREALIWIVCLVFLTCGAFLLALFLHARYYTPRLTGKEFHTEVPRPGQSERSPDWNPRLDADRPLDDADFPV